MVAADERLLGVGLYSVEEVSLYARLSPRLVKRWFFGAGEAGSTFRPKMLADDKFVSFLEFVQTMAIRAVRQPPYKIPLKKVRQLIEIAEAEQGIPYPFARRHTTYLFNGELVLKLDDGAYVEASGKHRRNRLLKEVVELYKQDLSFNADGLAESYRAYQWNGCDIAMNPTIRFGEPIVETCGYSAQTLWEASIAEGSLEAAAKAYGVAKKEVEAACRYFDFLGGSKAA